MSYSNVSGNELYNKGKETAISASSRITNIDLALKNQYWRIRQGYGEEAANDFLLNQANIQFQYLYKNAKCVFPDTNN